MASGYLLGLCEFNDIGKLMRSSMRIYNKISTESRESDFGIRRKTEKIILS